MSEPVAEWPNMYCPHDGPDGQLHVCCAAIQRRREHPAATPPNVIEFDVDSWGGHSSKAQVPGVPFMVNGVLHTLFSVLGVGQTWDGHPLVAVELRRETALERSAT